MSVRCGTLASDTDWQSGNVSLEDGEQGGVGCIHSISWSQLQAELEFSRELQGPRGQRTGTESLLYGFPEWWSHAEHCGASRVRHRVTKAASVTTNPQWAPRLLPCSVHPPSWTQRFPSRALQKAQEEMPRLRLKSDGFLQVAN